MRLVECASCGGSVKIKTFACSLYGECTLGKQIDGLKCCDVCGDFSGASRH